MDCVSLDSGLFEKFCVVVNTGSDVYVGMDKNSLFIVLGIEEYDTPWKIVELLLYVLGVKDPGDRGKLMKLFAKYIGASVSLAYTEDGAEAEIDTGGGGEESASGSDAGSATHMKGANRYIG